MIKELIKLADHLDKKGFKKEASYIDWIIKRASNNLNDEMSQYVLKELRKVNAIKAAEYLESVLKESDKLFFYKKGGFLKKDIYAKFKLSYRYFENTDHAPGSRGVYFDIYVNFVNKDGSKYDQKKGVSLTQQDKNAAFSTMYQKIQKPYSAVSRSNIISSSFFKGRAHMFYVRY